MINQLKERKAALQEVRERLNSDASLRTKEGLKYVRCLALLVMTEMQIDELQGNEKGRSAKAT